MGKRRELTTETLLRVAAENAGHPLAPERAEVYRAQLEGMLQGLEVLRRLPLKEVEPAPVFRPLELPRR